MNPRVKTGIPGLDELLNGGIPRRNVVLLAGGPGTGKTIFGQQFLYKGVSEYEEPGIYVALEEHPVQVRVNMASFGWDVKEFEEGGKFAIIDGFTAGIGEAAKRERYVIVDPTDAHLLMDTVRTAIKEIGAKRVVIDSVTTMYLTKPVIARNLVLQLKKILSGLGCTSILISQVSVTDRGFGGPGVEHAADGIIRLDLDEVDGELVRSMIIWKMRGTSHSLKRHNFKITDDGIIIL
ncbi:MAG: KaiC domain-containing protein [Candidatus Asgardarchaeia archaeon]